MFHNLLLNVVLFHLGTHTHMFYHTYFSSLDKGFGSIMFQILIFATFADMFLGAARGFALRKWNSTISIKGIAKHTAIVVVPMFVYPFVDMMGFGYVGDAGITFLAFAQASSVMENWIALGLPFKDSWKKYFDNKKIEQKEREQSIHTDDPVPDENEKKL